MWLDRRIVLLCLTALFCMAHAGTGWAAVWEANGLKFTNAQSEAHSTQLKSKKLTLQGKILETPVKISATGIECVECKIVQIGAGKTGAANGSGTYRLTGLTVEEPLGCKIATTLTTNLLERSYLERTEWTLTDLHASGSETGTLATFKLESCAAEGSFKLAGVLAGKTVRFGIFTVAPTTSFSSSFQAEEGKSLTFAGKPATISGEIADELLGLNAGKSWGISAE